MQRTTSTLGSDMRRLSDLIRGGSCPPSSPRPWTSLLTRAIHFVCPARWTGYRYVVRFDPVRSVPVEIFSEGKHTVEDRVVLFKYIFVMCLDNYGPSETINLCSRYVVHPKSK
jgi:hypothetical protein